MEALLLAEIDSVKNEGVSEEEIQRTVKKLLVSTLMGRDGSGAIASGINESIAIGDWTEYINGLDRLRKVTPDDVQRVVQKYLVEDQSTTGYFIPQMPGGGANPSKGANNLFEEKVPNYFRHPKHENSNPYLFNGENTNPAEKHQWY